MTPTRPCPDFEPLLLDRAGGSLDAAAATRLEAHLSTCEACRTEAAALEAALAAAKLPPPSDAEQRALDRAQAATLRHWRGAEGSRRNRSLMQGFAAGFAVAGAAAVLVVAPAAYRRLQIGAGPMPGDVAAASAGNGPDSPAAAAVAAGSPGWEPDLEADWEVAAVATGETPDEESDLPSADDVDLTDFTDE